MKVLPETSSVLKVPARTRSTTEAESSAIWAKDLVSASRTTETMSPLSAAVATPMWTSGRRRMRSGSSVALRPGCCRRASDTALTM
ncbi:unannotated protein [freshwater metagenome]|uniref:Unannotated protein n=1 Tax=freshwater metagenome TaxID=449393 RepID=A0A6J7K8J6_9ZZZZ